MPDDERHDGRPVPPGPVPDASLSMSRGDGERGAVVRVAAAGDVHCREEQRAEIAESFARIAEQADIVLLAGDLTTHGEPEQGAILADACRGLDVPIIAVLGNHDLHVDRGDELVAVLEDAGITVLERSWTRCTAGGRDVGVVGAKGFIGGFAGTSHLPDFGERQLRDVYRTTSDDVAALDEGLREVALCPIRIVLLHYAPTDETLRGEPLGIHAFLGSDRLAAPIREHEPDLVLHGHAHAGAFEGAIGGVPVYNVSVPVMGRDFWVFELTGVDRATAPIH